MKFEKIKESERERDETIKKIYKKKNTLKQHSSKRNDNKLERYTKRETERRWRQHDDQINYFK